MLGAIFQSFISLSIEGVRRSFFAQIEAAIKEIPHKKLISKKDRFEGMILVSRSTLKCQNSRLGVGSQVQMPGTGQGALLKLPDEIGQVQYDNISPQRVVTFFPRMSQI